MTVPAPKRPFNAPAYLAWEARLLAQPARAFSRSNTDQLYA